MMKTVFHIVSRFDLGGAEQVALNICKHGSTNFRYHIVEVVRARTPYTKHFISEMQKSHITFHRASVPLIRFHYVFERLAALLFPLRMLWLWLRYKPVAVHLHTEVPDMAYTWFAYMFPFAARRMHVVRTVHNTVLWTGLGKTGRLVERFMQAEASLVAVSQAVAEAYQQRFGKEIEVVRNGVESLQQTSYEHLLADKVNVVFAGRMERQKGIHTLVEIIKALRNDKRYFFHVFGDGSLRDFVEEQLSNLPNVRVERPLFNLPDVIGSFSFLLMPSEFEGLGLLSVEASLGGALPIVNNCAGLNETVPSTWPLMIEHNDVGQYVRLFNEKLATIDRNKLLCEVREFVAERYNVNTMVSRYEALYS